MDVQKLTDKEFCNLVCIFEEVADDSNKAYRRLEALREGTARPEGKDANGVLAMYKAKLEQAIEELDKLIKSEQVA